ncbi:MarR family transcriptional regulator [Sediminivirga luteola]|uniref:MarR family transcriptional regulator n=1 Tax=Sediminivirga luteola TaxID=1774748 RepID=UPI001F5A05C0|nr:helix-turn-helix domain-containing protein [Sediminivirga luteola]
MSTYTVSASRDGKYWLLRVPAVERVTQARHLREAEEMARDLVHIMTGDAPGSIDLDIQIELPPAVEKHLNAAAEARRVAEEAQHRAAAEWRAAAVELREAGLTVRDIARTLGVSHQRISQLLARRDAA